MRVNRHLLAISALFIIGLAVRFIPLLFSSLPFNIDGFPLVRISEDITDSGRWSLSYYEGTSDLITYNNKMPVFSLILSTFSLIFGKAPMEVAQYIIPFLSSIAIVIIYVIAYKITKNEMVSFFSGLVLALNGFYVYLGAAVMKQTIGLVILLMAVYLYQGRKDPKKRVLASLFLLILPLTHHLAAWIAFVMISLLMLASNAQMWYRGSFRSKRFIIDFFSGPLLFIFTLLYYESVNLGFYGRVSSINDFALFASIFILGSLLGVLFSLPKKRKKPKKVLLNRTLIILIGGLAILLANHYKMIFPGTIRTTTAMLMYLIPYLLLLIIGIIGLNVIATRRTEYKPFIAAIMLGPLIVILFAMLKGLDAFTFILVYRSYDYIDFGLAICAGVGAGFVINRMVKRFASKENATRAAFGIKASFSVVFLVICLSTVPLAYNGQEFYGVQDATYEYEFEAMSCLSDVDEDNHISSDERLSDIMNPYFGLDSDKTLPWKLKYGKEVESKTIIIIEDKWTRRGAQMSPMEPVKISKEVFDDILEKNDVIYTSGPIGSQIYIVVIR